jgi:hypothetical protein
MKLGIDAQRAIRFFAETLIAADLGPEDPIAWTQLFDSKRGRNYW